MLAMLLLAGYAFACFLTATTLKLHLQEVNTVNVIDYFKLLFLNGFKRRIHNFREKRIGNGI